MKKTRKKSNNRNFICKKNHRKSERKTKRFSRRNFMKRMICLILLASLMALSVAGCGKEKDTGVVSIRLIEE